MSNTPLFNISAQKRELSLYSPTLLPKASGFLWNSSMMLNMNCRGYAIAQHMQPEPAKYSIGPNLEAKTFIQPEHHYYTDHPGRFFYIKDNRNSQLFSLPYEPVRKQHDYFEFIVGDTELRWEIRQQNITYKLTLNLDADAPIEMWQLEIENAGDETAELTIYPYFSVGFKSWMNQSGTFDQGLNGIIANSITAYQKIHEYYENSELKDITYLLADRTPESWQANLKTFEGEGGLHNPDSINQQNLPKDEAIYAVPVAVMQHNVKLAPGETDQLRWLFGPAKDKQEISQIRHRFFVNPENFKIARQTNKQRITDTSHSFSMHSPDPLFNQFVNQWLPRQMKYHGEMHRLSTDPQTRNFLQDIMGMVFLSPDKARSAFLLALRQQHASGEMPDGILMHNKAELKYINQVPHSDHGVWLPIFLSVYISQTNDLSILSEVVSYKDSDDTDTIFEHIEKAMRFMQDNLDSRGLSLIDQGDWCDPMNMVGHKGKGVSSWLTFATSYAYQLWANICKKWDRQSESTTWLNLANQLNASANQYFWQNNWYARGITDEGNLFGIDSDPEGKIYLNPQTWSMLSKAADKDKTASMLNAVTEHLDTPFGVMMLAPSYTSMRTDIGRLTQKFPGTMENGSIYNHAAAFYAFSLFEIRQSDLAFEVLSKILVDTDTILAKGQLPIFIPNYYRGAYHQYKDAAGQSSQLFNTGTVAWFYRCIIEGMFGLRGDNGDLIIKPQIPSKWQQVSISRDFADARFEIEYQRKADISQDQIWLDGTQLSGNRITNIQAGYRYKLTVLIPQNVTSGGT